MEEIKNAILNKSYDFAVRIVKLYKYLSSQNHDAYSLFNQILRSGTSIGANVAESQSAQSKADFVSKLNISLKEANESAYWIKLLCDTDYITKEQRDNLLEDLYEIIRILITIIKTSKRDNLL